MTREEIVAQLEDWLPRPEANDNEEDWGFAIEDDATEEWRDGYRHGITKAIQYALMLLERLD